MTTALTTPQQPQARIACDQALHIAQQDAATAYRDLCGFRVTVVLLADGWHVDYELANKNFNGGGPHYVIDAVNGQILRKCYEQ